MRIRTMWTDIWLYSVFTRFPHRSPGSRDSIARISLAEKIYGAVGAHSHAIKTVCGEKIKNLPTVRESVMFLARSSLL